jgi:thiol-disulfide isomerase/thioredoxin
MDGERITNDSVNGKVLLIEFWATWCPPCEIDQPIVENLLEDTTFAAILEAMLAWARSTSERSLWMTSNP